MKEIKIDKEDYRYNFFEIEPGEVEDCNIGGILAIPNGEYKTNKLLTMFQSDKYKSSMKDKITGESKIVKTFDDSVERIMEGGISAFDALELEDQIVLLPLLPNDKRIGEKLEINENKFGAELFCKECFTKIPEGSEYSRLDKQVAEMIEYVQKKYQLDKKTNFFGHSTTGLSAMRFAMLQPQIIDNLIIGGNADEVPTPFGKNGSKLEFPFGIKDFEDIFGEKFNIEEFKNINFRYYIGEYEFADPNLDGIRDENYGVKRNGRLGSGDFFAPEAEADLYKSIYNSEYRADDNLSVYERLANVLKNYEEAGLNMKYKIYPEDCHSMIKGEDLYSAQFEDGGNFQTESSKQIFNLLQKIKSLEEFAKKGLESELSILREKAEQYQEISQKVQFDKKENDVEARIQILMELNDLKENQISIDQTQANAETAKLDDVMNAGKKVNEAEKATRNLSLEQKRDLVNEVKDKGSVDLNKEVEAERD